MPIQLSNINIMYFKFAMFLLSIIMEFFLNIFMQENKSALSWFCMDLHKNSRIPLAVYNQMISLFYLLKKNVDHATLHCKISQPMRNK